MRVKKTEKLSDKYTVHTWNRTNQDTQLSNRIGKYIKNSFPKTYEYRCTGPDSYFGSNWFTIRISVPNNRICVGIFRDSERVLPKNIQEMPDKAFQWDIEGDVTDADLEEIASAVNSYLKDWDPSNKERMLAREIPLNKLPYYKRYTRLSK